MIKSNFVADVIDLLLDSDDDAIAARPQIILINDMVYGYTSTGLFVTFSHGDDIIPYKCAKADLILNGLQITSPEHDFTAEATLYFRNGVIDYIEILCTGGTYPRRELAKYTLVQNWDGAPGRRIVRE